MDAGFFITGCLLTLGLLAVEHWLAARHRLPVAFVTVNGLVSIVLGLSGILEIWQGLS